jgi:hypothetical protein
MKAEERHQINSAMHDTGTILRMQVKEESRAGNYKDSRQAPDRCLGTAKMHQSWMLQKS